MTWTKIRDEKISQGFSDDSAYEFATNEMNKRRSNFDPESIIGMEENKAEEKLNENGYSLRVQKRDTGKGDTMYLDYRSSRCNVSIVKGCVYQIIDMG